MRFDAVVFDLDGTLLNTLDDLTDAVNYALQLHGLPLHSSAQIRALLGNGIRRLVECSVPDGTPRELTDAVFSAFKDRYSRYYLVKTAPYPGIPELLAALRARGVKTALVTNKANSIAQDIYRALFADLLPVAIGEQPCFAKKPAPDMVDEALRQLGCTREHAVYVGDSEVDLQTAKNSGLPCILVDWGFRDRAMLETLGNGAPVSTPHALLEALCS